MLKLIGRPLRAIVRWYLSKPRTYSYQDISIEVFPGVFHPGLFFSTRFILQFLESQDLDGKKFLELGSGSGLISVYAAKKGALVTATDINTMAVAATNQNSKRNNATVTVIHSDLFDQIPAGLFDWIVINPPYYPANPTSEEEYAWYCGEEHDYFKKLFTSLGRHLHPSSLVLIILSDVCDIPEIASIGSMNDFELHEIARRDVWADGKNYLYWIRVKR